MSQLGWTIIIGIKQHQNPAVFAAFPRSQQEMPSEFFVAVQESVSTDSDWRSYL